MRARVNESNVEEIKRVALSAKFSAPELAAYLEVHPKAVYSIISQWGIPVFGNYKKGSQEWTFYDPAWNLKEVAAPCGPEMEDIQDLGVWVETPTSTSGVAFQFPDMAPSIRGMCIPKAFLIYTQATGRRLPTLRKPCVFKDGNPLNCDPSNLESPHFVNHKASVAAKLRALNPEKES